MGLEINIILAYALGLILLYVVGWVLLVPLKLVGKLIWNGIIGGVCLLIFNFIGAYFGLNITINPLTALIVGFLGVPGLVLILALGMVL
ncbi:pro-sigmaK processing inhibitor BofA family protein [Alkaliphilus hydrothermalis]|uniref:Inhibitor of the pro-sigma K processing machinery n=1 Tax=Alkaliphilus hydrothermalis TaxID=1482730 RepID=A0ABS2NRI2_9FIRM|nr:pro-sigmaK processing inhibitor BofA family protein [Alkaliphilus hydrothermalis]MBM7615563.1 inhibitor of the pro-sigma K processing machinery [Alkaliphilus hydrothermalis]